MGGSSGGGPDRIDLTKLAKAADDRLRRIADSATRLLFVCELVDRQSLDSNLVRSGVFDTSRITVRDSSEQQAALSEVVGVSIVVAFTDHTTETSFLDLVAEQVLANQKQGIHVSGRPTSLIPSKATAYRWPSLNWAQLEAIFT